MSEKHGLLLHIGEFGRGLDQIKIFLCKTRLSDGTMLEKTGRGPPNDPLVNAALSLAALGAGPATFQILSLLRSRNAGRMQL